MGVFFMNYNAVKNGDERSELPRLVIGTLNPEGEKNPKKSGLGISSLNALFTVIDDNRTTGNGWYMSVKSFPRGDVEMVALKLGSDDSLKRGGGAGRKNKEKQAMTDEVLKKSQLRAKKLIRHKLMMMEADRMLTLTYKENVTDIKQAWSDFKKFSRLMKWRYNDQWQYVCVPEYQKRGAVHFHIAIKGYYHANTVRRLWHKVVAKGNIDITSPRLIKKESWNPKRIANYLSKYISKNDSVEFNKRRYSSSSIDLPPSLTGWVALGLPITAVMYKLMNMVTRKQHRDYWEADGVFPICMMTT